MKITFDELEAVMDDYMTRLPSSNTKAFEAEDLQSEFLEIQDIMAKVILELELKYSELSAVAKMEFKRAMMHDNEGKTAPEKKACAEGDIDYQEIELEKDSTKNRITYLKTRLNIFNDAHLCCRTIAKGES
jgi:hypothetical protein